MANNTNLTPASQKQTVRRVLAYIRPHLPRLLLSLLLALISVALTLFLAIACLAAGCAVGFLGGGIVSAKQFKSDEAPQVLVEGELQIHFLELGNKYTGDCTYIKAGETDILSDAGSKTSSIPTISEYLNQYVTDGKLDLSSIRMLPRRELLPLLPDYHAGTHMKNPTAQKYIRQKACRRVHIRTPEPVRVSFDGEIIRTSSLRLRIEPGAVQFCIPC